MNILLKAKRLTRVVSYVFFGAVIGFVLGFAQLAYAEVADLAGAPLTTSATSVVKPNATFILIPASDIATSTISAMNNTTPRCFRGKPDFLG